jgi:hypothetical protein
MAIVLVRWTVGGTLLAAGLMKWMDPWQFGWTVARYPWVREPFGLLLGGWLIWIELWVGAALLAWPKLRHGAWVLSSALFALFAVAIVLALVHHRSIPCGCFGVHALRTVSWAHALADLAAAVLCGCMARKDLASARSEAPGKAFRARAGRWVP